MDHGYLGPCTGTCWTELTCCMRELVGGVLPLAVIAWSKNKPREHITPRSKADVTVRRFLGHPLNFMLSINCFEFRACQFPVPLFSVHTESRTHAFVFMRTLPCCTAFCSSCSRKNITHLHGSGALRSNADAVSAAQTHQRLGSR